MFTGIIEEIGKIERIKKTGNELHFTINCPVISGDTVSGASIATNGVCLTVESIYSNTITLFLSEETLAVSSLSELKKGDFVNLEKACTMQTTLDGHIVSGHIDTTGRIISIRKESLSRLLSIEFDPAWKKFIAPKGSIAIDGISLTVNRVLESSLEIQIIPETWKNTVLQYKRAGSQVNIEIDTIARYIVNYLENNVEKKGKKKNDPDKNKITEAFLRSQGF